jgi:hypothetical protein
VPPELAEPLGAVKVGDAQDVKEFGASRRREASSRSRSTASIWSKVMDERQYVRPILTERYALAARDAAFFCHRRSERNAARTSVEKSSGSSQAAKWPPLSNSLK